MIATPFSGIVEQAVFQGSSLQLVVHLADDTELVATVDNHDNPESLAVGSPIALTWDPTAPFVLEGRSAVIGATTTDVDEVQASLDGKDGAADTTVEAAPGPSVGRRALLIGGGALAAAVVVGGVLRFTGDGSGNTDVGRSAGSSTLGEGGTLGAGAKNLRS